MHPDTTLIIVHPETRGSIKRSCATLDKKNHQKNHYLDVSKKCVETYSSRFRNYTLISQKERNS